MRKPIIGITSNILITEGGSLPGTERVSVSNDYIKAVLQAGAVPMVLPVVTDKEIIKYQSDVIDGLLLSGGYDVDPLLFGEEPAKKLGFVYPARDIHEIELIKAIYHDNKPILGICRGIQVINIVFGGTLYQDLAEIQGGIKHMQNAPKDAASHTVRVSADSILHEIFGEKVVTNSFHHQAVKELGSDFIISAKTKDGIVEAIEIPGERFIVAVQWHPEMMVKGHIGMQRLFSEFVADAAKFKNSRYKYS